jgi:hypothetical protein
MKEKSYKETCAVYVPANMTHCPLFTKVGTPFFFVVSDVSEYSAIVDGKKQAIRYAPRKPKIAAT